MSHFIVSVALPIRLRKLFDYLPASANQQPSFYQPGKRCLVPFGSRTLIGIVIRAKQHTNLPIEKLKAISSLLDDKPFFCESTLEIYQWISQYYHAPLGEVILSALPPLLKKPIHQAELCNKISSTTWRAAANRTGPTEPKVRGPRQQALLTLLAKHPEGLSQKTILANGFQMAQLKTLQLKKLISSHQQIIFSACAQQASTPPTLNEEQYRVFREIGKYTGEFAPILLDGITGSGKTEVYISWLHHLLMSDQKAGGAGQALILVPEIALTPQTIQRFKQYFGSQIVSYHSAMPAKERLLSWVLTQQNKARIIIGTRSALLLPFTTLLTIVVDEEHDASFKQQDGARYNARDVAILRARQHNCPVIMGSATPSFESLYNASISRFIKLNLTNRHTRQPLPKFRIIDIKSRPLDGGISPPAMLTIRQKLTDGEQVMVFINRRGYAPVIMCTDCGWFAECQSCDVKLTFHLHQHLLRCHHCDHTYPLPKQCPQCASPKIQPVGAGTERTEEILAKRFPDTPIIRIDRDNTQSAKELKRFLTQINSGIPCIIVGTQMLAKGHDFPNLNTVLIVNADGGLFSSDFRAVEKTAQLVLQVSGRAGRHKQQGQVLLQTQLPEHVIIRALAQHDYKAIYDAEITMRRQAKLPPVFQLCIIRADAADMNKGISTLKSFKRELEGRADHSTRILGPVHSVLQRKQNRYHSLLWVLSVNKGSLRKLLHRWLQWREQEGLTTSSKVRWLVDVDPIDTL